MGVREFRVTVDGHEFSGRCTESSEGDAFGSPVIVAIHGGTYFSKYFDIDGYSLLARGGIRGLRVVAIDRPGYGQSTPLPDAPDLLHRNALHLHGHIPSIVAELSAPPTHIFVVGHSMGGAIAITIAALGPEWLSGIAVSGIGTVVPAGLGDTFAELPKEDLVTLPTPMKDVVMFGPEESVAEDMPEASHAANTTVPLSELFDVTSGWVDRFPPLAEKVTVPVHYRQAELDNLWVTDPPIVEAFARSFRQAPRVDSSVATGVGHCIDFHKGSAEFQNDQLDFALGCTSK